MIIYWKKLESCSFFKDVKIIEKKKRWILIYFSQQRHQCYEEQY